MTNEIKLSKKELSEELDIDNPKIGDTFGTDRIDFVWGDYVITRIEGDNVYVREKEGAHD